MKHFFYTLTAVLAMLFAGNIHVQAQTPIYSFEELHDGYYQIVYQGQAFTTNSVVEDDEEALGTYFTSYKEEFSAASNNQYYPLGLSAPIEGEIGRTFLRITRSVDTEGKFNIQTQNGHYLTLLAKASITPVDLTLGNIEGGGVYILGYLPFAENCWESTKVNGEFKYIVGKSGNQQQPLNIYPAPLQDYDVYQLSLVLPEAESHETTIEYSRVECVNENNVGLSKVYDGGYFVFPKDTELSEEDFVCPEFDHLDPVITIEDGAISVSYEEAVWFVDITYHYYYNDKEVGTESFHCPEGEPYPAPGSNGYLMALGVSADAPEGLVEDGKYDIDVTLSVDASALPFQYAEDAASFESIDHWYHLVIADASYLAYDPESDHFELNVTDIDVDKKANYRWAFVGNPVEGFQLVNRGAGFGYVLSSSRFVDDGDTGGKTMPTMVDVRTLGEADVWQFSVELSPYVKEGAFYLGFTTDEGQNVFMNKRGSVLAYWTSGRDSGSTFYAEEVFAGAETLADAIRSAEEAAEIFRSTLGCPGYPTEAAIEALEDLIGEAKYVLGDPNSSENDYYTLAYDLERQVSATRNDIAYPVADTYYAFVNHQQNGDVHTLYMTEDGLAVAVGQTPAEVGEAAAFLCIPDTTEHTYQFYNPAFDRYLVWRGHRDGYNDNKGFTTPDDAADAGRVFTLITLYPAGSYYEGAFLIHGLRANGNPGTFVLMATGVFDAYSLAYGWTDRFSNMFTVENVNDTGITQPSVVSPQPSDAIYDLTGRRVLAPSRGIYIQNGKKVMVR